MANTENHSEPDHGSPVADQTGEVKPAAHAPEAPTAVQSKEPEDAYLTGGQRNLQRRVLGLNVEANHSQRPAEQSPGLHSTGSFTGVANGDKGEEK
jgi:hypothetical protein